ncbi:hypothetical protein C1N62_08930 [Nissabacter sp. SGAir0207]|nr:hypothetical protein C1N62_08930 [Nissabacter sp. SGAir0207]
MVALLPLAGGVITHLCYQSVDLQKPAPRGFFCGLKLGRNNKNEHTSSRSGVTERQRPLPQ